MRTVSIAKGIEIHPLAGPALAQVLSAEAIEFLANLHRRFEPSRQQLLRRRQERQAEFDAGKRPTFLTGDDAARGRWRIIPVPSDLEDRKVEITGPTDRKMMINALNSGAKCYMADFEDANAPTWSNLVEGQRNLQDAVRRTLSYTAPDGREYRLNRRVATLMVRPRGWHLPERHVRVDGEPMSGALFDFALFVFHNGQALVDRGSGVYLYLPKLENRQEARLWNDVFVAVETALGLPAGTIRATVLIETITAAFEMEEILWELRTHAAGLNAGRWDYIFSIIKKFRDDASFVLPDRSQIMMDVPFMKAYTRRLVDVCHKHGAHAMGGMSAFIPDRSDAEVNARALARVREDKQREVIDGFDGTWVAHPALVPIALEVFNKALGTRPHQLTRVLPPADVTQRELLDLRIKDGGVTFQGLVQNVNVGLRYIESWLRGVGAAAIDHLMEDAATAEICRSQVWQWAHHNVGLDDGQIVTPDLVRVVLHQQLNVVKEQLDPNAWDSSRFPEAADIFERVALEHPFPEFLTLSAYERID